MNSLFNKKTKEESTTYDTTPHGLRHSIETLLHLKGVDIRDLQDWLGHESVTSTNRYTRSDYKKQVATGGTVLQVFDKKDNLTKNKKTINQKRFVVKKKEHSY